MIPDFLLSVYELILRLWLESHVSFYTALTIGLILGAISWWIAFLTARNINLRFSFFFSHYLLCTIAAILTLLFTLLFFAFRYTAFVAEGVVIQWEQSILVDSHWRTQTYQKAYEAVYDLKDHSSGKQLEDFSHSPHPKTGKDTFIPAANKLSQKMVAEVYSKSAVEHFQNQNPFLSKIIWARASMTEDSIVADIQRVFSTSESTTYPIEDAIGIAGKMIKDGLKEQIPRVVKISRILLVVFFLLLQSMTIGLLAWAAHRDIKVNFPSQQ